MSCLILTSCIFVDKISIKVAVFSNNSVLLAVSWHLRAHSLVKLMPATLTATSFYNFMLCNVIYHFPNKNKLIIYFYRHTVLIFMALCPVSTQYEQKDKNKKSVTMPEELLTSSSKPRETSKLRAAISSFIRTPCSETSPAWQQQFG